MSGVPAWLRVFEAADSSGEPEGRLTPELFRTFRLWVDPTGTS